MPTTSARRRRRRATPSCSIGWQRSSRTQPLGQTKTGRQGDKQKGISDLNTAREAKSEIPNPKSEIDPLRTPHSALRTPWSLKSLHRLIVTSAAYRQSTYYAALRAPNSALAARFFQRAIAAD